jgi:serine phosphatase RsbU (regulator of sigma subunit)
MDGMKYKEYDIQMKPGAKLFMYTDGLTEAVNDQKEMFGTDRILEVLNQSKDLSSQQIVENMKAAVNVFIQNTEPFDDLTMMCVCYNGSDTQEP